MGWTRGQCLARCLAVRSGGRLRPGRARVVLAGRPCRGIVDLRPAGRVGDRHRRADPTRRGAPVRLVAGVDQFRSGRGEWCAPPDPARRPVGLGVGAGPGRALRAADRRAGRAARLPPGADRQRGLFGRRHRIGGTGHRGLDVPRPARAVAIRARIAAPGRHALLHRAGSVDAGLPGADHLGRAGRPRGRAAGPLPDAHHAAARRGRCGAGGRRRGRHPLVARKRAGHVPAGWAGPPRLAAVRCAGRHGGPASVLRRGVRAGRGRRSGRTRTAGAHGGLHRGRPGGPGGADAGPVLHRPAPAGRPAARTGRVDHSDHPPGGAARAAAVPGRPGGQPPGPAAEGAGGHVAGAVHRAATGAGRAADAATRTGPPCPARPAHRAGQPGAAARTPGAGAGRRPRRPRRRAAAA